MHACPTCPNRWIADLFEALGSPEKAEEIRKAGCQWLWNVWIDGEGGQPEPRTVCGSSHMPEALNKLGAEVTLASKTIQKDRNEQAKALGAIESAMAEHGAGEGLQALAKVGLLATVGRRVDASTEELPEGEK